MPCLAETPPDQSREPHSLGVRERGLPSSPPGLPRPPRRRPLACLPRHDGNPPKRMSKDIASNARSIEEPSVLADGSRAQHAQRGIVACHPVHAERASHHPNERSGQEPTTEIVDDHGTLCDTVHLLEGEA